MSLAERKRTFEIAVEEIGGARTILSCSDQNLDTVIELAKHAQAIGSDFIVVHAPVLHFLTAQDETLMAYYRAVSEQVDIGIALWSHPDFGLPDESRSCARGSPTYPTSSRSNTACRGRCTRKLTRLAGDKLIVSHRLRGRVVRQHRRTRLAALSLLVAALRLSRPRSTAGCATTPTLPSAARSRAPKPCVTASTRCARPSGARGRPRNSMRIRNTGRSCSARPAARCGGRCSN